MDGWSILIGILGALATVGSTVVLFVKSRGENRNATFHAKTALDARIDARMAVQLESAWERITVVETTLKDLEARESRRTGAITRIFRAIAQQWPSEVHGPDLDPLDISEISETMPPQWIRNNSKRS